MANAYAVSEIFAYVCELGDIQQDVVYTALRDASRIMDSSPRGMPLPLRSQGFLSGSNEVSRSGSRNVAQKTAVVEFGRLSCKEATGLSPAVGQGSYSGRFTVGRETVQLAASAFVLRKVYKDMFAWGKQIA